MDPSNNKVLYAATYQRRRATWGFNGGGPGSAIYKTSDAGRTWTKLTNGIPTGPLGRIGIDVYRNNPNIVYARIEHETESGTYRSDDAGLSVAEDVRHQSAADVLQPDPHRPDQRPAHLRARRRRSTSPMTAARPSSRTARCTPTITRCGSIRTIRTTSSTATTAASGSATTRAQSWEGIYNMDLAQYYHVAYDMETPYNVCGGLQDNYTWCGPSAVRSRTGIVNDDWLQIQGGDGFEAQMDPPTIALVYAESQDGNIVRVDRRTNERKAIRPLAGARRAAAALELEHADRALAARLRTPSTSAPTRSSSPPTAARRGRRSARTSRRTRSRQR